MERIMRSSLALPILMLVLVAGTRTPALAQQVEANAAADGMRARSDYELVERIGTKSAWQVFLIQYPTGFYADLARAQLYKLDGGM
jgi:hypothetical protein